MVSDNEREIELAAIDPAGGLDDLLIFGSPATRRVFLKQVAGSAATTLRPSRSKPGPSISIRPRDFERLKENHG